MRILTRLMIPAGRLSFWRRRAGTEVDFVNVEGHQEGTAKGYNPKRLGNLCYNIQFAFCDELKAYITGFVRSGNTYTANGAAEMIKEIVANIKTDDLEIMFRMDSGYFDEDIIETIESLGCKYLIKGKEYPTLASQKLFVKFMSRW